MENTVNMPANESHGLERLPIDMVISLEPFLSILCLLIGPASHE